MKENIGVFLMTLLLMFLLMFGFKACTKDSGDNFGKLDYSQAGNDVTYPQANKYNEVQTITAETPLIEYSFTTDGAALSSYKIKNKKNPDKKTELVLAHQDKLPFRLYWGNDRRNPDRSKYTYKDLSTETKHIHQFKTTILDNDKKPVDVIKTFTLLDDSYMWTMNVEFKTANNQIPNLGEGGYSYSVYYGPQLGPEYRKLSKKNAQYDEERLIYEDFINEKGKHKGKNLMRSQIIANTRTTSDGIKYYVEPMTEKKMNWVALTGKYFLFVAEVPQQTQHLYYASNSVDKNDSQFDMVYENEFFLSQRAFTDKNAKDTNSTFYFYMGPRNSGCLKRSEKSFGREDLDFSKLSSKGFLGLNVVVEKIIGFINYNMHVNNWGWSIILFTVLLKILLFGLTKKSYESTAKMQALGPKMAEIKEKYQDDPQVMQAKTMELYQQEKINPMGGCLPLLIQMPILIAIFAFINNSYEMKNEPFIWWINDLSAPDAVINFAKAIPVLGWKSLNLLPIIYVLTQILSTIIMKPKKPKLSKEEKAAKKKEKKKADPQAMQMWLMQYGMPILFFFILYSAPSGLFVYWITMNIFTILQQVGYQKYQDWKMKNNKEDSNKTKGPKGGSKSGKILKSPSKKGMKIKNA